MEVDQASETPSVHLGVDAFVPAGTAVRSPSAADVVAVSADQIVLRSHPVDITLAEIEPAVDPGDVVAAGEVVGRVSPRRP